MNYNDIREDAYQANMLLPAHGLVIFTFGNVSVADHKAGVFAIKPSGVPYEELTPAKMVVVDFDGKTVEGDLRPSSDTKTHAVLYKNWPNVGSVAHTHSTYATAWSQTLRDIPLYGTTHADHLTIDIPCAEPMDDDLIMGDYEHATGLQILGLFSRRGISYEEVEMILLGNHAPFTWGANSKKAVYNSVVLESLAKMAFITESINPDVKRMKESLIRKHYQRKHGEGGYYGQ